MPTPFESATLNLKLFELRREAVLREAREWFLRDFNPETFAELIEIVSVVLGAPDGAASIKRRSVALKAAARMRPGR